MNIMEWTEGESPLVMAKRYGVLEQVYRARLEARLEARRNGPGSGPNNLRIGSRV